ncbi:MAG TPA: 2-amino-4-hydroxy-6-hydroxymethyldihydropteridine diphosphokinase [Spirochaetales bacterium]|nr:2-amino-4-hydroxy-6-hydroxymethyldihydropteridine diphosphokinase [Spirochaetales bacterium]
MGLGSNVGDSLAILRGALEALGAFLSGLRSSSVYRSAPRYVVDQADFLNLVALGETDLAPAELLTRTQAVEASFGRDRTKERRKGPRSLDVDVLLYGDLVIDLPELLVPHPGMTERAFVLVPLAELSPALVDPRDGQPFSHRLGDVADQGIYLHAGPPLYCRNDAWKQ